MLHNIWDKIIVLSFYNWCSNSRGTVRCPSWRSLSSVWILVRQTTHFKGRLRSLTATCSVLTKQRRQSTLCLQGYVWMIALALLQTIHCNGKRRYSQLSPCGHLAITDTLIIRTAAKSPAKNKLQTFNWHKFPLLRTLTVKDTNSQAEGVCNKGNWL